MCEEDDRMHTPYAKSLALEEALLLPINGICRQQLNYNSRTNDFNNISDSIFQQRCVSTSQSGAAIRYASKECYSPSCSHDPKHNYGCPIIQNRIPPISHIGTSHP